MLIAIVRLIFWSYALSRTRLWFLSLLALDALINVFFGLISLAMLWDTRAWTERLGREGFMTFYNVLLCTQLMGQLIEIIGVIFLVMWLCRSHLLLSNACKTSAPTAMKL